MPDILSKMISGMSWASFRNAKDLHMRIFFTLGALIVYRIGGYVPLPGVNAEVVAEIVQRNSGGFLGVLDMFSGGALGRMTLMTLSIAPYISASIAVQILSFAIPSLEALRKEGDSGRRKLNQYTRYATVGLAIFQAYVVSVALESIYQAGVFAVLDPGLVFRISTVVSLVGATLFAMWLGEQINQRGIGNGISLLIYAGIVANLPQALIKVFALGRVGAISLLSLLVFLIASFFFFAFIVFVERANRRILIQYPRAQGSQAQSSYMPLKLNAAGVMPPILSMAFLGMLLGLLRFIASSFSLESMSTWLSSLTHGNWAFVTIYALLIIVFSFVYTGIVFNPKETADNLHKNGGFMAGLRPGSATEQYLSSVVKRLTLFGAIYLVLVCTVPEILQSKVAMSFYFGGTGLLIMVSVSMDIVSQVQAKMFSHQYSALLKKARKKKLI